MSEAKLPERFFDGLEPAIVGESELRKAMNQKVLRAPVKTRPCGFVECKDVLLPQAPVEKGEGGDI